MLRQMIWQLGAWILVLQLCVFEHKLKLCHFLGKESGMNLTSLGIVAALPVIN